MIKARHVVQRDIDLVDQLRRLRLASVDIQLAERIEAGLEQCHKLPGQVDVRAERRSEIGLAVRGSGLSQVPADSTQDRYLLPAEVGSHDEGVEAIGLAEAGIGRREGIHELLPGRYRPSRRTAASHPGTVIPKS